MRAESDEPVYAAFVPSKEARWFSAEDRPIAEDGLIADDLHDLDDDSSQGEHSGRLPNARALFLLSELESLYERSAAGLVPPLT